MSVRADDDLIRLEGECGVEEAETLVGLLQSTGVSRVDLSQCRHLHSAVVQALLVFRVRIVGESPTPFVRDFIIPALDSAGRGAAKGLPEAEAVEHQPKRVAQASPSERS